MGIYGAINAAVSGLAAQARALENISGNVANSQTTGYKRLDTTFSDLVSGGGSKQSNQVSGTTYATSRATNTLQGDIESNKDVDTYMAINGEGYFVVTSASDVVDGQTTFADSEYYTRAGDFEIDENGYLVNGSGYYLMGFELDPNTGNAVGDSVGVIRIDDQPLAAQASTEIEYQANLPLTPTSVPIYDGTNPASALLDITGAGVGPGDIAPGDETTFLEGTISGGTTTIYNQNGSPLDVEVRWGKTANAAGAVNDTWNLYISSGGNTPAWYQMGSVEFDGAGDLTAVNAGVNGTVNGSGDGFDIATITIGEVTTTNVEFSFANGDLTGYSDVSGKASSVTLDQDGFPAGEIVGIAIDESGRINATYSNSQVRGLYEIPLATFDAEQELRRVDGAAFAATPTSGEPDLTGGGAILSNSLELSNADIATEFAKLIVTQQAYSANSKVVTSSDEMLNDALNMIR